MHVDRAVDAKDLQHQALKAQKPGQSHHKGRDADIGDQQALQHAQHDAQSQCGQTGNRSAEPGHQQDGHQGGAGSGGGGGRQVDLAQQQDHGQTDRQRTDDRRLHEQVVEVARAEEHRRGDAKVQPDRDQRQDHRQERPKAGGSDLLKPDEERKFGLRLH